MSCIVNAYINNMGSEILSLTVPSINNFILFIDYFNKYPLLGVKHKDYKEWKIVYNMIISKKLCFFAIKVD